MKRIIRLLVLAALLLSSALLSPVAADRSDGEFFRVRPNAVEGGPGIDETVINGPPDPPPGIARATVFALPRTNVTAGVNIISGVPAFDWSFGCSATSAAMIAGYYDRTGFADIYTGPTNGGVMPLDNSAWPAWQDPGGDWRSQCPLSATHQGLDERTELGHVDDYWYVYGEPGPDPFIDNWPEHEYGDCTGDFMKTNQSVHGNIDGGTTFYNFTDGSPLHWDQMEGYDIDGVDGGYGVKLFYESRGYTVTEMYNQYIYGYNGNTKGFTFDQYQTEIDAGRPVMFHVTGHTMVGTGYDDSTNRMYIHDTWDYSQHYMTWGGTYSGMQHYAVTIVRLAGVSSPPAPPSNLIATAAGADQIDLTWTDNAIDETGFGVERRPDGGIWTQVAAVGANTASYADTGLAPNTTYHYRVYAFNTYGDSTYSNEASATSADVPPTVTITAPAGGATVAGAIDVVADASDDIGVTQVEFFVDGGSIGTDGNGGDGWSVAWDTTTVGNGGHTLSATATDTGGQTGSDSISVTVANSDTTPPAPPSGLVAAAGDAAVDLSWTENTDPDLAGYTVYRSTASGGPYSAVTASLLLNASYTDESVTNGTTYYYVATASDHSGNESSYSNEAPATPQAQIGEDVASADYATIYGTVAGTYVDTHAQDGIDQAITEKHTGGKLSTRRDGLEHVWTFDVTGGNHIFNVDAYYDDAGDADAGIHFSWSTSPTGPWNYLLTVVKTADDGEHQAVDLGAPSGTIYIRAIDTDRTSGQNLNDTLHVDHMFLGGGVPPTGPPDPAANPDPEDGATGIATSPTWSWAAGAGAQAHDVYFGTVAGALPLVSEGQAGTTFTPGPLDLDTAYYWRIDEVNSIGTTEGGEWSFKTGSTVAPATMHVGSIEVGMVRVNKVKQRGTATVIVVDDQGGFVGAATVYGTFAGSVNESQSALSDANGVAVLTASGMSQDPAFTFCVDDVSHVSLSYAAGDNAVTCATYP